MSKVNVYELKKFVVTVKECEWKWKEFSLKSICNSEVYGNCKLQLNNKPATIKEAVAEYQHLANLGKWTEAKVVKNKVWDTLDAISKKRISSHYDDPEVRIKSVNKPLPDNNDIIAYFELENNYYNGEKTEVPVTYRENIPVYYKDAKGKSFLHHYATYEEDCGGIATNSTVTFSDFMRTHPSYTWLPKAIEVAKQFGIEPNWRVFKQGNTRGIGLTVHDAKELQQVANWYSGMSDADKEDFSDKIWLHHEDGIQSIQVSEREYKTNLEKWQDWKETENRDFRCDLYEDEEWD